ncbi:uncharacterized protein LOC135216045 [Macrobrachium nipponense]|uniref:uncharacterized protein LOC135216045 n=1 Tax=Macrobrachium nipponense TaxID=159736 RepID=UPI0030C84806
MRLLILCPIALLALLPTASPRRAITRKRPGPHNRDTAISATTTGQELPCGEHHLPLKQKFIINSEIAQDQCNWTLRVQEDTTNIKIGCTIRLRESENCRDAYVQFFDTWRVKQKYCGRQRNLVTSQSGNGLLLVRALAKTDKFSRKELGTFSCEISTELKLNLTVKDPEPEEPEEELPLPPHLSFLERIIYSLVDFGYQVIDQ